MYFKHNKSTFDLPCVLYFSILKPDIFLGNKWIIIVIHISFIKKHIFYCILDISRDLSGKEIEKILVENIF